MTIPHMDVYVPHSFKTKQGTPYLQEPGVALLAQPSFEPEALAPFIDGFDDLFDTRDYIDDCYVASSSDLSGYERTEGGDRVRKLDDGAQLVKFAGQLCYFSVGKARTRNDDAQKYLDHIKESGHGSVLEHANYSFLFYGIDRSVTHELVRHRAGFAYSQVSQRYVSGRTLRFVERPEYQNDMVLHELFEDRIDLARKNYDALAAHLTQTMPDLEGMAKTDARKAVNQTARSSLPNETEAPIVVTGNARAWRHFIEMRASKYAETTIRKMASITCSILRTVSPLIFGDYAFDDDTPHAWTTKYRKV